MGFVCHDCCVASLEVESVGGGGGGGGVGGGGNQFTLNS